MRPVIAVTLAFATGCGIGLRFPSPGSPALAACIVAGVVAWLRLRSAGAARITLRRAAILFGGIGVGAGSGAAHDAARDCRTALPDGARVEIVGMPEGVALPGGSTLVDIGAMRVAGRAVACSGMLRMRIPPHAKPPAAGRAIAVNGRWLMTPHTGHWPVSPERRGILVASSVTEVASRKGSPMVALRSHAQARIRARFGESAGMVEAVLLARREALDPGLSAAFAASGLSHLLAISGTHVGLVAAAILALGRMARLSVRSASILGGGLTTGYVVLLGAPYAAARAAVQVLLVLGARLLQRPADPYALMASAALLLIAIQPTALLDAGFQLSFAGVFGLLAFQPAIRRALPSALPAAAAETLAATAAATAATMPIAAMHFGMVSYIGLLTNLVAVPLTGLAVPAAAAALAADVVHPAAGAFVAGGATIPFVLLERTARLGAAVPGGSASWGPGTVTAVLLASCAFLLLLRTARGRSQNGGRPLRASAIALAGAVLVASLPVPALRAGALEVHVIDVGQGDAIAVRTPRGGWIVVDTGPRTERWDAGLAAVAPYLRERGARRIDVMVLTHPHLDHIGGAASLMRAMPVEILLDAAVPASSSSFVEALAAARDARVRVYAARAGREVVLDRVTLSLLAPADSMLDGLRDPNDVSVVFRLAYGRFGALFTGDAPRSVENALVAVHDSTLAADLLKVGHHGSRTSTGDSLLLAVRPRLAVVSVGARNRYGHPDRGVVERLARHGVRVLRTDRNGSIVVRVAPNGTFTLAYER